VLSSAAGIGEHSLLLLKPINLYNDIHSMPSIETQRPTIFWPNHRIPFIPSGASGEVA
jgi:hypothetical protein